MTDSLYFRDTGSLSFPTVTVSAEERLAEAFDVIQRVGDISMAVLCGGLKVTLICTFYGLIVYFISLIIRVIQKPRI